MRNKHMDSLSNEKTFILSFVPRYGYNLDTWQYTHCIVWIQGRESEMMKFYFTFSYIKELKIIESKIEKIREKISY